MRPAVGLVLYGAASAAADRYEPGPTKRTGDGFIVKLKDWMKEFF